MTKVLQSRDAAAVVNAATPDHGAIYPPNHTALQLAVLADEATGLGEDDAAAGTALQDEDGDSDSRPADPVSNAGNAPNFTPVVKITGLDGPSSSTFDTIGGPADALPVAGLRMSQDLLGGLDDPVSSADLPSEVLVQQIQFDRLEPLSSNQERPSVKAEKPRETRPETTEHPLSGQKPPDARPFDRADFDDLPGGGPGISHVIRHSAQIDGENGFRIVGDTAHGLGKLGYSVASGDFNGDGFSDIIAGAPFADSPAFARDDAGRTILNGDRGKTVVVFGGQNTSSPSILVSDSGSRPADPVSKAGNAPNFTPVVKITGFDGPGASAFDSIGGPADALPVAGLGMPQDLLGGLDGPVSSAGLASQVLVQQIQFDRLEPLSSNQERPSFKTEKPRETRPETTEHPLQSAEHPLPGQKPPDARPFDRADFDDLPGGGPGISHVIRHSAQIDGENGFRIVGDAAHGLGKLGYSVASGDFNGDGFSDIIAGAPFADSPSFARDDAGRTILNGDRGKTVVVFGGQNTSSSSILVSDIDGSNGFSFLGAVNSRGGYSVAGVGDFNGDGNDDILIGGTNGRHGHGYLLFGTSDQLAEILQAEDLDGRNGVVLEGTSYEIEWLGGATSSAGDLNADGLDDLAISASWSYANGDRHAGQAFVVFGTQNDLEPTIRLEELDGSDGFGMSGPGESANLGTDLVSPGDINGDGFEDLIIALGPRGATDEVKSVGGTMVLFGQDNGTFSGADPTGLDGKNGFMVGTSDLESYESSSHGRVAALGDVNGDGIRDFLVSISSVRSYVVYGTDESLGAFLNLNSLTSEQGFLIEGTPTSFYPTRFAGDVDFNADGYDDILLSGQTVIHDGELVPGRAAIVLGGPSDQMNSLTLDEVSGSVGLTIIGSEVLSGFGASIAAAGDVNGDGIDDIVVGAPGGELDGISPSQLPPGVRWVDSDADGALNGVGHAYVIYGVTPDEPVIRIGAAGDQTIRGGAFNDGLAGEGGDDRLFGGGGDDRLFGGTGDDVLIGGAGADVLGGNEGTDTASYEDAVAGVVANLGEPEANTGDAAGDVYIDIANLTGSAFDDVLIGDEFANVLNGLGGDDLMTGGLGADTFIAGAGNDTVSDFRPGLDTIDLSAFSFASFSDALALAHSIGGNTVFDFGGGDSLSLNDTNPAVLNAHNLIV